LYGIEARGVLWKCLLMAMGRVTALDDNLRAMIEACFSYDVPIWEEEAN
jgi:hypothetical protein